MVDGIPTATSSRVDPRTRTSISCCRCWFIGMVRHRWWWELRYSLAIAGDRLPWVLVESGSGVIAWSAGPRVARRDFAWRHHKSLVVLAKWREAANSPAINARRPHQVRLAASASGETVGKRRHHASVTPPGIRRPEPGAQRRCSATTVRAGGSFRRSRSMEWNGMEWNGMEWNGRNGMEWLALIAASAQFPAS